MRRATLLLSIVVGLFAMSMSTPSFADDTQNPWAAPERHAAQPTKSSRGGSRFYASYEEGSRDVQSMIVHTVTARLGSQWADTALRIARIESGFRCNARNGRAVGVFQNTRPEAFGVSRSAALTCAGGVTAGVAHMERCIRLGASNSLQMMRCHNSGTPFGRLDRNYRRILAMR